MKHYKIYAAFLTAILLVSLMSCRSTEEKVNLEDLFSDTTDLKGTTAAIKDLMVSNISLDAGKLLALSVALKTDQSEITWEGLKVSRSGSASDNDVTSVSIYQDDGDGKFDSAADKVIGVSAFKKGEAEIKIKPAQPVGKDLKFYFLTVEVSRDAQTGVEFSIDITSETAFQTNDPLGVRAAEYIPFASKSCRINPTVDRLIVTARDISSLYLKEGSADSPMFRFTLKAEKKVVVWSDVKLSRSGTVGDLDIIAVKIYSDDGDGKFDPAKDKKIGEGTFLDGIADVDVEDQTVTVEPKVYYIACDINAAAPSGQFFGIKCESPESFGIVPPNSVSAEGFPFASGTEGKGSQIGLDWKAVLIERVREKTVEQQKDEVMAQQFYETALKLYKEANYKQAIDNVQKALELDPHHLGAEKLLIDLRRLLFGDRAGEYKTVLEDAQDRLAIKVQQIEIEIRNHFLKAEEYMREEKFTEAISEYEAIEEKLKWDPYGFQTIARYREQSKERSVIAAERLKKQQEMLSIQQRRAAEDLAKEEEERRRAEFNLKIKRLFEESVLNFEQQRYKEAERLADKVLILVPTFRPAQALKNDCQYAQHKDVRTDYLKRRVMTWKVFQEDFDESFIPYASSPFVQYDSEIWEKALRREPIGLVEEKTAEDPDILEMKRTLETARENITVNEEHGLAEQLEFISQRYNIPVYYGAEALEKLTAERKNFSLANTPLKLILKYALDGYGLSYIFRDKALWIVKKDDATPEKQVKVYHVDDLVYQVQNFSAPSVETPFQTAAGVNFPVPPPVDLPAKPAMGLDNLMGLIRQNVFEGTWEDGDNKDNAIKGTAVKPIGTNKLMVIHTADAQREVNEFLKVLRSYAGTMIAVDANFLGVTDDFLEEMSVNLKDTPGAGSVVGGAAAGFARPAGQSGNTSFDFRFRGNYPFAVGAVQDPAANISGARLTNAGGLGGRLTVLRPGDTNDLNFVFRAIEKKQKIISLHAPKIVALNAQQAYVIFLQQLSYIRDLDAIAGVIAYDPVLDTLQVGVVLDVMPVMSYDRKYITLHTLSTMLELDAIRNYDFQNGVEIPQDLIDQGFTGYFIQLPQLRVERARTSVVVPDKGSIILGGLKTGRNRTTKQGTPVLNKVPLVGGLFRREINSDDKQNMIIMMKAQIIELAEIEKENQD
jgi:Flp pilus assembly secretin CpaC/tetratricopeptide (TPR) repeat protein